MSFIESENKFHSLSELDGRAIGQYRIQLRLQPLRHRTGWASFFLYLKDSSGKTSLQKGPTGQWVGGPFLEGIYSKGGKGVRGWIEVGHYFPVVCFEGHGARQKPVDLSEKKLDQKIFQLLSEKVPPGGHLMFSYEVSYESRFHLETRLALTKGVPPVSTTQGELLFRAGFRLIKDWYLAEGGHEGPRKLWGEKPSNQLEACEFDLKTFLQLLRFLIRRPDPDCTGIEDSAKKRSLEVLEELALDPSLSTLRNGVVKNYKNRPYGEKHTDATNLCCDLLKQMLEAKQIKDTRIAEDLAALLKMCS